MTTRIAFNYATIGSSIASVLLFVGFFGSSRAIAELPSGPPLTVLMYNYSAASGTTLNRAEETADSVFGRSGIRFAWTDCWPSSNPSTAQQCQSETALNEIRVRIVGEPATKYWPGDVFGFAVNPVWATVYYDRAVYLAMNLADSSLNVSRMLGYLIVHEIGHLLLGKHSHTVGGIMQGRWDLRLIQQIFKGQASFSLAQRKRMFRNMQLRTYSAIF